MVKGDWRKESQFILTTQDFWFWLKGIGEGISVYPNHTGFLVLVKGEWRKESQFSPAK